MSVFLRIPLRLRRRSRGSPIVPDLTRSTPRCWREASCLSLMSYYMMNLKLDELSYKNLGAARKLTAVLDYIAENIEQNMTIHDLAEIAYMHPNYFMRLFKQQIGVPPIQYITRQKIEKAKELLTTTSGSVSAIADQLGFGDLFYFSKQFKKHAGLTPTEFRKHKSGGMI